MRKILYAFIGFASIYTYGCRTASNIIEDSPLGFVGQSVTSTLNDPDISKAVKEYFPNGKAELSYRTGKQDSTRLFLRPEFHNKDGVISYGATLGIEKKF